VARDTDVHPVSVELYFLPVRTRVPLKFGPETLTHVTCARARVWVADGSGNTAEGWGETGRACGSPTAAATPRRGGGRRP